MQLAEGCIVAGRFQLVRELASGGMGFIWLANHLELGYLCAIKFIRPDLSELPEVCARFEGEAKIAAQLRSPYIVQILDYGTWEGAPYMAMEYLEGEDLRERLDKRDRLEAGETFAIVDQVARALGKAHAARLIHRDLKPENIFLVRDDDREIVKVLDFGIAKAIGGRAGAVRTQQGVLIGTLEYMSPEQLRGTGEIDHRCDLWALGVLTFACLTGHLPFEAERLNDLIARLFGGPLPRPSTLVAGLPREVDAWWERAAARNIADRFSTAREMVDALADALGQAPASSRRPQRLAVVSDTEATPLMPQAVAARSAMTVAGVQPPEAGSAPATVSSEDDSDEIDVCVTGLFARAPGAPDSTGPIWLASAALDAPRRGRAWRKAAAMLMVATLLGVLTWEWRVLRGPIASTQQGGTANGAPAAAAPPMAPAAAPAPSRDVPPPPPPALEMKPVEVDARLPRPSPRGRPARSPQAAAPARTANPASDPLHGRR
jgi:serine/threonine-protein kinase